jgi:hypothetical protein
VSPQNKAGAKGTQSDAKRGGLPEGDSSLDALAALANNAFASPAAPAPPAPAHPEAGSAPSPIAPPAPVPPGQRTGGAVPAPPAPAPTAPPRPAPVPAAPAGPTDPAVSDNRFTQVTSVIDVTVLARFEQYQLQEKIRNGSEPANTVVVFQAINDAVSKNRLQPLVGTLEPEEEPGQLLSLNAPGRRVSREKRKTDQLSWRPTFANLAVIDRVWEQHGFPNRSKFVELCLNDFLPPLEQRRRSSRKA